MTSSPTPRLILSPCGTSLLTNDSTDEERRLLNRQSNIKAVEDMGADRAKVEQRVANVRASMERVDATQARRASAE